MMRVIVEIHPHGDSSNVRRIAKVDIANITELAPHSDYVVQAELDGVLKRTYVKDHVRSAGWMPLVSKVLESLMKGDTR